MTDSLLEKAHPHSQWLARQLDHQRLELARLDDWLPRPLTPEDFAGFDT